MKLLQLRSFTLDRRNYGKISKYYICMKEGWVAQKVYALGALVLRPLERPSATPLGKRVGGTIQNF